MFGFGEKTLTFCKVFLDGFSSVLGCFSFFGLVWIGFKEFLCKENDEVSKELLSKNFKIPVFILAIS